MRYNATPFTLETPILMHLHHSIRILLYSLEWIVVQESRFGMVDPTTPTVTKLYYSNDFECDNMSIDRRWPGESTYFIDHAMQACEAQGISRQPRFMAHGTRRVALPPGYL